MRYLAFLCTLCLALSFSSCGDDDAVIDEVTGIVFQGTAANNFESCGWLIEINGVPYLPNVLNSQFREEGLRVALKVEFLGERSDCAPSTIAPERIRIEQIRRAD